MKQFFHEDTTLATKHMSEIFLQYTDIGEMMVERTDKKDILAECFPRAKTKTLLLSELLLSYQPRNFHQQKNYLLLLFFVVIHECAHFLTPVVNAVKNLSSNTATPEYIGKITLPNRSVVGSDCGYGQQQIILDGGILSFDDESTLNELRILKVQDTSLPATGYNIVRFSISTAQCDDVCTLIDNWFILQQRSFVTNMCCYYSCGPREFPIEHLKRLFRSSKQIEDQLAVSLKKNVDEAVSEENVNISLDEEYAKARTMIRVHFDGTPPITPLSSEPARKREIDEFRGHGTQGRSPGSKI